MFLRLRNWSFELRDDHLYLDHGVFTRTRSMVPYVRVQHIDTQRGPVYRLLDLSKVVVYTAGSKGADENIPGLSRSDAAQVQEKLRDLAIESEDMDAV
jgi:membrane protein YdbS with pleckstrin-like domain